MPIIIPSGSGDGVALTALRSYVRDELGADLGSEEMISNDDIDRYLNDGMQRLGYYREMIETLEWVANDVTVALPDDYIALDRLIPDAGYRLSPQSIWGRQLNLSDSLGSGTDGAARLFYYASWPTLTDAQDSLLPDPGNVAIVAFAVYRCYKRIGSSRAEYRRYSTITQANGVSMDDLMQMAEAYYNEFLEARDSLPLRNAATYFGD